MKFIKKTAGVYQANCYIIYDEETMDGFIVDPGGDADEILEIIKANCISAKFIILTHGHFDHTGAVNSIKSDLKIPALINEKDNFFVSGEANFKGIPSSDKIYIDKFVSDNDVMKYGKEELRIIETPGHTPGSITISTGGCLFTGDTLFAGSIGRTDLPGGSYEDIIDSIKTKILIFPDSTKIYPGHGPSTSIYEEKMINPYI